MIKANAHKYSVSTMCRVLQVNRSSYYYEAKQKPNESGLSSEITEIFEASRNNYGTRKIKKELMKTGKRRRIGRIMKQNALVSNSQPHNSSRTKTPATNPTQKISLTANSMTGNTGTL